MLSTQLLEHIGEIRRADQARPFPGGDSSSMEDGMGTLDAPLYFEQLQLLLQEAERLQFKNTTKYLAKKYYDIFLNKYPQFPTQNSILLIITCLRTAAKFNQTPEIYELYTLDYCMEQSSNQYSKENFIQCQIELLRALSFKLSMTTPYDFLVVKCLMPHLKQAMNILNSIIDFALSLPQLRQSSAQGIFFGALIYSCKQKNESPISYNIINAITYRWEQAIQIAGALDHNLKRLLQE